MTYRPDYYHTKKGDIEISAKRQPGAKKKAEWEVGYMNHGGYHSVIRGTSRTLMMALNDAEKHVPMANADREKYLKKLADAA